MINSEELIYSYNLAQDLRMCGFKVDIDLLGKNMKSKFKEAEKVNPKYLIIAVHPTEKRKNIYVK